MQKARRHPPLARLRPLVSVWFQGLFTPLLGVLFTFPSRYWFTIGLSGVSSLTRWCWQLQTEFLRFRPTRLHLYNLFVYRTVTSLGHTFQYVQLKLYRLYGLVRVRSPLLAESLLISFPTGTQMFQFPAFAINQVFNLMGCPIRTSTDYRSFAPPRSFSQLTTSFVASESLGIRHTPLVRFLLFITIMPA